MILRAVTDDGSAYSAGGGTYTVYKGESSNLAKDIDGVELPEGMAPGASGVFWVGRLPYGEYRVVGGGKTYTLKVGDDTPETKTAGGATAETAPGSRDGVTVK